MIIKVKEILESRPINLRSGETAIKTQILTDDGQNLWVWGRPSVGEEIEGDVQETQFGREFKRARKSVGRVGGRSVGDPDTMLIAYAKDIVTSFVESGAIKEPQEAVKHWQYFSKIGFALYDNRKRENKQNGWPPGPGQGAKPVEEKDEVPF